MNKEKLLTDLAKLIEVDKAILKDTFNLREAVNWDSLSVVSTIAAIDHHYKLSITGAELMDCNFISNIFSLIENKLLQK